MFPSARCTPRTKGIFAPGDFLGQMRGRGTGSSGEGQGLEQAPGGGSQHSSRPRPPPCPQLDREHRVAGFFPRPTFKDKSTYVESSTKVYDDVSTPTVGRGGGFRALQSPGWGVTGHLPAG